MNVKEAVTKAKIYANEFLAEESSSPFQLEEVIFDHSRGSWRITLGYYSVDTMPATDVLTEWTQKNYKVFEIMDNDGTLVDTKTRYLR